ncbi:hypothetical protein LCGC14_0563980 [marine sediment metagenome]|uniref:Uncharacterized protein n=1 Tax=marine sediment metagenome TaxID=412755 RepID=A0A0F9RL81_9ZZZZ
MNEDLFIRKSKKIISNGFKLSKITIQKKEKYKIILEYKKGNDDKLIELQSITESIIVIY